MKTGLVLEGGGIRGIFTAGILDVLMEEGIEFDGAVGVSAGAAFGGNYKSGQARRTIRYNLRYAKDPRYSSFRSLLATGDLFNAQFCYHDIPEKHDPLDWDSFYKNPMEFYLVATDCETGKPVYHLCDESEDNYETLEWFRASGSMPLVSRVVEVGVKWPRPINVPWTYTRVGDIREKTTVGQPVQDAMLLRAKRYNFTMTTSWHIINLHSISYVKAQNSVIVPSIVAELFPSVIESVGSIGIDPNLVIELMKARRFKCYCCPHQAHSKIKRFSQIMATNHHLFCSLTLYMQYTFVAMQENQVVSTNHAIAGRVRECNGNMLASKITRHRDAFDNNIKP